MKANIFGKGKKRKKDKSGGKAGGGRGKNSGGGAGDAGSPKSRLSGQARHSPADRERPPGRPGKQARRGASVHDSYFRKVFSKKKYTPDIFQLALPEKLYNLLDWSSLEVEMKTFLSEEMRERRTDILCSVKIKNGGGRLGLLFLLEHRSHQGKGHPPDSSGVSDSGLPGLEDAHHPNCALQRKKAKVDPAPGFSWLAAAGF